MKTEIVSGHILIVEDDLEDRLLMVDAWAQCGLAVQLHFVTDGEQLLQQLHRSLLVSSNPLRLPSLILLDLNLPGKTGREALEEVKSQAAFQHIPVVVMTTSRNQEDVDWAYRIGVNSYISKPARYDDLVETMQTIGKYWFDTVELPSTRAT